MSRLAKKPVAVPQGVLVELKDHELKLKGPKGELGRKFPLEVNFEIRAGEIYVKPVKEIKGLSALLGTSVRHLQNMVEGVTQGFEKKLELEGIGFKAEIRGKDLVLSLGFSHSIVVPAPKDISFSVEKNKITISGTDKETVGNTAAIIRSYKKPEPYKGKGIHYAGEIIRRKAGKKVVTAG